MSTDPGTWVAALLTLAVFSYLWRENPVFRFAEHLFVGVASGYVFVLQWRNVIRPNLVDRAMDPALPVQERLMLAIPLLLGLCMLARAVPRIAHLSRIAAAFIVGFVVGTNLPQQLKVKVMGQITSTVQDRPLVGWDGAEPWNHLVFLIGVFSVLLYFVFSVPRSPVVARGLTRAGLVGRLFLMVAFGATFGNTVMARVSVLIGRAQFLMRDWLGIGS